MSDANTKEGALLLEALVRHAVHIRECIKVCEIEGSSLPAPPAVLAAHRADLEMLDRLYAKIQAREDSGRQSLASAPPAPIQHNFEYEVRMAVSIPLAWATLLKQSAEHHYDYKCREAGERGVVNGLFNTAQDGEFPSTYAVSWSNLDLITKVAEQLEHHTNDHALIRAIRTWLRESMDAIARQREACMELPGSRKEHA